MGPICRSKSKVRGDQVIDQGEFGDTGLDENISFFDNLVLKREDGLVMTNVPHLVVHHSPTGFEWGYSGSGPADLALNICEMYLRGAGSQGEKMKCFRGECFTLAWKLHQPFKRDFIATAPVEGITYPFQYVKDWFEACGVVIQEGGSDGCEGIPKVSSSDSY